MFSAIITKNIYYDYHNEMVFDYKVDQKRLIMNFGILYHFTVQLLYIQKSIKRLIMLNNKNIGTLHQIFNKHWDIEYMNEIKPLGMKDVET